VGLSALRYSRYFFGLERASCSSQQFGWAIAPLLFAFARLFA